ncbi:MAG: DUF507 family protein [Deltaproteobacteria bacterium]|nr:DUF507 family protein [Deltaproteobacteria bacterium]
MRLHKEQVEKLSRTIVETLKAKDLVVLKTDERKVLERIEAAILDDLRAEDALDREVEQMLQGHSGAIDTQKIDYRKMFSMIKNRLAKERGLVL